jgi:hypothetical protein
MIWPKMIWRKMIYKNLTMNKYFQISGLLIILVFLYASPGFAQDEEPATTLPSETDIEEAKPESEEVPSGQEVEINEDNYRRFMELKETRGQRNMIPETSYKSQAGLQKLDKLPEASQKHLRNQLREIIVQGEQWQPGDEGTDYPYVPSDAASTDQSLQKQEAEAWGELVENYHQREAEIYANSSRSGAAAASASASGAGAGAGGEQGSAGSGSGKDGDGQQANQERRAQQDGAADSYSPNVSNDPNAKSTAGISQNAMEFLQKSGNQTGEGSTGTPAGDNEPGSAQEQAQEKAQAQAQSGQQSSNEQQAATSESSAQNPSDEAETESTSGASQNALEYLMGDNSQAQPGDQEGTLTIEDLMNAQGVYTVTGGGEKPPDENDPDKDGG